MDQSINKEFTHTLKPKNQAISTILAFALLPLSGFATDIYIPSLPSMAADMHISSIQVQLNQLWRFSAFYRQRGRQFWAL
jgi:hypothetical protein